MIVLTILKQNMKWSTLTCQLQGVVITFYLKHISQLECNNLNSAQYTRRETLKINPVPSDIADDVLEQSVCQALSLTEYQ